MDENRLINLSIAINAEMGDAKQVIVYYLL